jgi:broad specificity phosphatase PhoE
MAILILVRHGQASFGSENYDRLSDLGWQQSQWLGEYFKDRGLNFHSVHSGTLERQRDTARGILDAMGCSNQSISEDAGFNEYHAEPVLRAYLGDVDPVEMQNSSYRDYWRAFRRAMAAWAADELTDIPESWDAFGQRMTRALHQCVQSTERDDIVLAVSSGGAITRGLSDLLDMSASSAIELNLQFRNSAFCELIASSAGLRLINMNTYPHLDRADRRHAITSA